MTKQTTLPNMHKLFVLVDVYTCPIHVDDLINCESIIILLCTLKNDYNWCHGGGEVIANGGFL